MLYTYEITFKVGNEILVEKVAASCLGNAKAIAWGRIPDRDSASIVKTESRIPLDNSGR